MDTEHSTLARPYARAAFGYAADAGDGAADAWRAALDTLAAVVCEPPVAVLIAAPLAAADKAAQLGGLLGEALDGKQRNFVRLLADNGRLALLPAIATAFRCLYAERRGEVAVELRCARALDDSVTEMLRERLGQRLQGEVLLSVSDDPSLLGGATLRIGDRVIDGSLRGRLAALANALRAA